MRTEHRHGRGPGYCPPLGSSELCIPGPHRCGSGLCEAVSALPCRQGRNRPSREWAPPPATASPQCCQAPLLCSPIPVLPWPSPHPIGGVHSNTGRYDFAGSAAFHEQNRNGGMTPDGSAHLWQVPEGLLCALGLPTHPPAPVFSLCWFQAETRWRMRTILWVQVLSSPETEVHPLLETTKVRQTTQRCPASGSHLTTPGAGEMEEKLACGTEIGAGTMERGALPPTLQHLSCVPCLSLLDLWWNIVGSPQGRMDRDLEATGK
ncbi:hypothetical protein Cadr_000007012 [Camelus dromedarius]|uniref:Uncharacterized protein n=1 Tax=Camelus dromedarius TaxID=9838 RepID=A0A5N4E6F9_CAMDR|nr:hypothetical protein Cadr_000007012 [Camelus dromedarius]